MLNILNWEHANALENLHNVYYKVYNYFGRYMFIIVLFTVIVAFSRIYLKVLINLLDTLLKKDKEEKIKKNKEEK